MLLPLLLQLRLFAFCSNFELLHLRAIICNNLTSHTEPHEQAIRIPYGIVGACFGRIHMSLCIFMSNIFYKHHCAYWIKNKLKIQKYSLAGSTGSSQVKAIRRLASQFATPSSIFLLSEVHHCGKCCAEPPTSFSRPESRIQKPEPRTERPKERISRMRKDVPSLECVCKSIVTAI